MIRGHERQRCGIFLFCKDAISSQRVQGYASETVSCCALCCLFDASQLITLPIESYCFSASSNSKHNYSVCARLQASISTMTWGAALPVLSYTHFLVCKCPLHTLKLCCNMINAEVVPAVARAPEHCACPLDCLQLQWWNQTHLSAVLILNCTSFIILLPGTTPWKNKNNHRWIQFDKAVIGFTNIWEEMWSQIIYLMKSCDIGHM